MSRYRYDAAPSSGAAPLGLLVLQVDETVEMDMRRMLPAEQPFYVSRVPSGDEVTPETLRKMKGALTAAAQLLPQAEQYAAVGYACTSATGEIGAQAVASMVRAGVATARVTDPLTALRAACAALGVRRLALLSPYIAPVSDKLRAALAAGGIETPLFGSFEEPVERNVVRISETSIESAAVDLVGSGGVDALFLSCTNLRTLPVIDRIEARTGLPCLSSNQVLAWHMCARSRVPGTLGRTGGGGQTVT
ncbi:Asp/Glu racemase [Sulfitobacter sp. HNIBRBA3233]|uniref:maleate cis-trans isomerase family protein n=1 Tax=Sulfitobacter marinivivus TaxID=3158558 RepID=UPI0032DEBD25